MSEIRIAATKKQTMKQYQEPFALAMQKPQNIHLCKSIATGILFFVYWFRYSIRVPAIWSVNLLIQLLTHLLLEKLEISLNHFTQHFTCNKKKPFTNHFAIKHLLIYCCTSWKFKFQLLTSFIYSTSWKFKLELFFLK